MTRLYVMPGASCRQGRWHAGTTSRVCHHHETRALANTPIPAPPIFSRPADVLRDIEREIAAYLEKRRKKQGKTGPTSFWDDLAGVGEEFVEFLESVRGLSLCILSEVGDFCLLQAWITLPPSMHSSMLLAPCTPFHWSAHPLLICDLCPAQGLGLQDEEGAGKDQAEAGARDKASEQRNGSGVHAASGAEARRKREEDAAAQRKREEDAAAAQRAASPTIEDELSELRKKLGL